MLEAIAALERYLHRGRAVFEQDELLQGWFVRNLQIIGEAARSLPESTRMLAPEVEWHQIIGMRNVLVHGYFDIDAASSGMLRAEMPWRSVPYRTALAAPGGPV